jgi:hypothetical protein
MVLLAWCIAYGKPWVKNAMIHNEAGGKIN